MWSRGPTWTRRLRARRWEVVRDVAWRLRHPATVNGATGRGARVSDHRGVRGAAACVGASVAGEGVDREAQGRGAVDVVRLRAARAAVTGAMRRRGPRRHPGPQSVLETHVARRGQAAPVRPNDRGGLGAIRRVPGAPCSRSPAWCVRRSADNRGVQSADLRRRLHAGVVSPSVQCGEPLTTETSRTAVPIPADLAMELLAAVARWGGDTMVTDGMGGRRPGGASSA